jgi:hypothetical protein
MPKHSTTRKRPHFDRPEVSEILVDALRGVDINGGVLRFEFVVNRFTEPNIRTINRRTVEPIQRVA